MSDRKDGGPAFPYSGMWAGYGMSLRDYFAAQVLCGWFYRHDMSDAKFAAATAYAIADAMLEARERS
jgi:hypothetical protein